MSVEITDACHQCNRTSRWALEDYEKVAGVCRRCLSKAEGTMSINLDLPPRIEPPAKPRRALRHHIAGALHFAGDMLMLAGYALSRLANRIDPHPDNAPSDSAPHAGRATRTG